jgi:hypothetical protein
MSHDRRSFPTASTASPASTPSSGPPLAGPRRRRWWSGLRHPSLGLLLVVAVITGYAATNVGELSPDPETRYLVAESIVREGDLAIEPNGLTAAADDGTHYSVFFPGQTVSFLPVAAVFEVGRRIVGGDPETWRRLGDFTSAMFVVPAIAALAVLGHVTLLRDGGLGRRAATTGGLMLAFATAQWVWGTAGSEEVSLGACTVWAMVLGLRAVRRVAALDDDADAATVAAARRRIVRELGVGGGLIAFGLAHRGTAIAAAIGYVVLTLPTLLRHRRHLLPITWGLVPWVALAGLIVGLVPLYNLARYGDPLDSGYGRFYEGVGGLWATPWLEGLGGHLISPGKSIFLYSPWLLLLGPAVASRRVRRTLGPLGPAIAITALVHLLLYARTTFWAGAFGFGVRFHVCMLPLLLVPIAVWWWGDRGAAAAPRRTRPVAAAVGVLALLSVTMQGLGLALNTGYEYLADRSAYDAEESRIPRAAAWDPARSPIRIRTEAVLRKIGGADILPPGEPEAKRIQAAWNVFPVRAAVMLGDGPRTQALFVLWAGLMAAFGGVLTWLALRLRRDGPDDEPEPDRGPDPGPHGA